MVLKVVTAAIILFSFSKFLLVKNGHFITLSGNTWVNDTSICLAVGIYWFISDLPPFLMSSK